MKTLRVVIMLVLVLISVHLVDSRQLFRRTKKLNSLSYRVRIGGYRGGFSESDFVEAKQTQLSAIQPVPLFNTLLAILSVTSFGWKGVIEFQRKEICQPVNVSSADSRQLRNQFLAGYWCYRMADWLQGPYYYEVYSGKSFNGEQLSLKAIAALGTTSHAVTGLLGPVIIALADRIGRKSSMLLLLVLNTVSVFCLFSSSLSVLFVGRIISGIAAAILHITPETWLLEQHKERGYDDQWLTSTFGTAFSGESVIGVASGWVAGRAVSYLGPVGPFLLSLLCMSVGYINVLFGWQESKRARIPITTKKDGHISVFSSIRQYVSICAANQSALLVGVLQALVESSMYLFIFMWPPLLKRQFTALPLDDNSPSLPFGTIFACLMTCMFLGSTAFAQLPINRSSSVGQPQKGSYLSAAENVLLYTLVLASISVATMGMIGKNWISPSSTALYSLICSLFCFELCLGMYFPNSGFIRGKYFDDRSRSTLVGASRLLQSLFVLAAMTVSRWCGVESLWFVAASYLAIAAVCSYNLDVKNCK